MKDLHIHEMVNRVNNENNSSRQHIGHITIATLSKMATQNLSKYSSFSKDEWWLYQVKLSLSQKLSLAISIIILLFYLYYMYIHNKSTIQIAIKAQIWLLLTCSELKHLSAVHIVASHSWKPKYLIDTKKRKFLANSVLQIWSAFSRC